jgi:hypothetical protein
VSGLKHDFSIQKGPKLRAQGTAKAAGIANSEKKPRKKIKKIGLHYIYTSSVCTFARTGPGLSVRENFLIIYLYCKICRKKGDDEVVLCRDCDDCADETVKFVDIGPHDQAYAKIK